MKIPNAGLFVVCRKQPGDQTEMKTTTSPFPVKCVDWSYPTSTNATKFKFPAGYWTVNVTKWNKLGTALVTSAVKAFATKEEAIAHASAMPENWSSWAKKHLL